MSNKPQNQSTFHCPLPNLKIIIQLVYCLTWIFTMLTIPNKNNISLRAREMCALHGGVTALARVSSLLP